MTGRRLAVVVAIGALGLTCTGSALASGSSAGWQYVVTNVTGSAMWQYSGPAGSGVDKVNFRGRIRHGAPMASASSVLHGKATYTSQNSQGCGPVTRSRTQFYRGPHFWIQAPFVFASWNFPLPNQSYCSDPIGSTGLRMLQGMMLQKLPLSQFTCLRMTLSLGGQSQLTQGGTTGRLTYHATVIIKRI